MEKFKFCSLTTNHKLSKLSVNYSNSFAKSKFDEGMIRKNSFD